MTGLERLRAWIDPPDQPTVGPRVRLPFRTVNGTGVGYAQTALSSEAARVAQAVEGTRNHTLNEAAFNLGQLVAVKVLTVEEVEAALTDAAITCGLGTMEILKTMRSGLVAGMGRPRDIPARSDAPSHPPADPGQFDELYLSRSQLATLPTPEPLIDGVLDRRTLFVVRGRDQSYKSFLTLSWLLSIASGARWLDREARRGKVLYVVGEGAYGLHGRVSAWETAWRTTVPDDRFHVRRAPLSLFGRTEAFNDLLARVERERYDVVVFDTLQRMSAGADTNHARDAGMIIDALGQVREVTDGTVGVVAHTDKGDNDTRGSSAFEDDADIVWSLKVDEDDGSVQATLAKRKDGPDGLTLQLRPRPIPGSGSLVLERATQVVVADRRPPARATEVLRVLAGSSVGEDGLSSTAIGQALGLRGNGSIMQTMNYLIDVGYVQKCPRGRFVFYKLRVHDVSTLPVMGEHAGQA